MDLKYYLIFTLSIITLSVLVFLITKTYLENKNNNNTEKNLSKDDENQIVQLKGAVSQLSRTIEERPILLESGESGSFINPMFTRKAFQKKGRKHSD